MKLLYSILINPFYHLYCFLLKIILNLYGYKLNPNDKLYKKDFIDKKKITYLFESPLIADTDFDEEFESSSIYFTDRDNKIKSISFKEFYCLDDRFCSWPDKIEKFKDRNGNILFTTTRKNYLPGHKKRFELQKNVLNYDSFFELNLKKRRVLDLYEYYKNYKYVVVIENCNEKNYVSEKFYDVIKSGAIPIYHKKNHYDFVYVYLDFESITFPQKILDKIQLFENEYNVQDKSNENFLKLEKLRENIKLQHLKYLAYPYFAISKIILSTSPFYKIIRILKYPATLFKKYLK